MEQVRQSEFVQSVVQYGEVDDDADDDDDDDDKQYALQKLHDCSNTCF